MSTSTMTKATTLTEERVKALMDTGNAGMLDALNATLPPGTLEDKRTAAVEHINNRGKITSSIVMVYVSEYRKNAEKIAAAAAKAEVVKAVAATVATTATTATTAGVRAIALRSGTAYAPASLPASFDAALQFATGRFWDKDITPALRALHVPTEVIDSLTEPRKKQDGTLTKGDFAGAITTVVAYMIAETIRKESK